MTLEHRVMTKNAGPRAHYMKLDANGAIEWVRDYKQAATWTWPSEAEAAICEAQARWPDWAFRVVRTHDDFWKKTKKPKAKPAAEAS